MRIKKTFREIFLDVDFPVLAIRPETIAYLTGFYSTARRPGQLGLCCTLVDEEKSRLYVPENWKKEAQDQLRDIPVEVFGYSQGKDELARMLLLSIPENVVRLGIEPEFMDFELYASLMKQRECCFVSVTESLNYAKAIKTDEEISALRKSARLATDAMEYAKTLVRPGIREYEMAAEIEHYMRLRGSDGTPFTMKALSGPNSAVTIKIPGERKVCRGDCVLFDFGATVDRYISDWTRTFCCGDASAKQKEIYELVRTIELACIEQIKPGIQIFELMQTALAIAKDHPLGRWFNPYLGHSIGLASSEWPQLKNGVKATLQQGMVLTIEPGVYLPEVGGVRIEDEVLVTETGHEVWTGLKHEQFEVYN